MVAAPAAAVHTAGEPQGEATTAAASKEEAEEANKEAAAAETAAATKAPASTATVEVTMPTVAKEAVTSEAPHRSSHRMDAPQHQGSMGPPQGTRADTHGCPQAQSKTQSPECPSCARHSRRSAPPNHRSCSSTRSSSCSHRSLGSAAPQASLAAAATEERMVTPMAEETERPMVDQMELVMAAQQAVPTVGTAEATAEATAAIQAVGTAKEPRARCSSETTRTQVCRNHTHERPAESPADSKRRQRRRNHSRPHHCTHSSTAHPRSGSPAATEAMMATAASEAAPEEETKTYPSTQCRCNRARKHLQGAHSRCRSPHDTPSSSQDQS